MERKVPQKLKPAFLLSGGGTAGSRALPKTIVESRTSADADGDATPRFPSPLIKPDVPVSGLSKIDEILAWERRKEAERDTRFVELGRYLCEVRAGQYWRVENVKSFVCV